MKHIFIVNPTSGSGKAKKIGENIERICTEENIDYDIHYTRFPNEATAFAKMYKNEKYIIYSVGGDGTLNEVVNGIVGSKNMLGIVPAGSGNDFYKILETIDEPHKTVDLGKINNRYFINVASIGIDAEVGYNAELMKKSKIPSSQIYNASILYTFFKYKYKYLKYRLNRQKKEGTFTLISICNSRYYGGGYLIGPNALIDDGLFDIYLADKISKLKIPFLLGKLKKGQHENNPSIKKIRSDEMVIYSDKDIICQVDGEILVSNKFKVKLLKKAITICNNRQLIDKFMNT